MRIKYPRTPHLPWSLGATSDDKTLSAAQAAKIFAATEVVVTEKLDGENCTIYPDGTCHARSLDSNNHPSRSVVRALAAQVGPQIPTGWRVCGENLYAQHAIEYSDLPSHFLVFGIYDETNHRLPWDDMVQYCEMLGLHTVPVLYRGIYDETLIKGLHTGVSTLGGVQEGYVVTHAGPIAHAEFGKHAAKFVRHGHVQEGSEHWMHQAVVPNRLRAL